LFFSRHEGLWDIDEGITDVPRFVRLLAELFPEATLFCAEGTRIAPAIAAVYSKHAAPGTNPAPRQTLFPSASRYSCRPSPAFYTELREAATGREPHEVLDHLFVFAEERRLIEWHDAFANALWVHGSVPQATVAALAAPFGLRYHR
jgi:hypothetical protein